MSIRIKRLIAFVIDWNITFFPFVLIFSFLTIILRQQSEINPLFALFLFLLVILPFGAFVLRDVIFKGRSLGKRICGLYVYEKSTLNQANAKQCLLRNVFLFLYIIDGIILLATGETIGDRVAGTLVASQQGIESYNQEIQDGSAINTLPVSKMNRAKGVILTFAIIIGCLFIFIGIIQIVLNAQKNTEEYKIAYCYFIESKAFKEMNVDESRIHFNQYSSHTDILADSDSISQTVEIGFIVNFKSFVVVCHNENGIWQVCNECTLFE